MACRPCYPPQTCQPSVDWARYPATRNVDVDCHRIVDVSGIAFCDGTYIGPGDSFDISSSQVLVLSGTADTSGAYNGASVISRDRIYQQLDPSWNAMNGFLGLAKDAAPALNPISSGVKAVSTWNTRTTNSNQWLSVCWSPELRLFVAVAVTGSTNRAMTSPDGINWTTRTTPVNNQWQSVCWAAEAPNGLGGTGLFVAVAVATPGANNLAMTSPDGITWTTSTTNDTSWQSVCWAAEAPNGLGGTGLFVAVGAHADNTRTDRVMTSPDGITWTIRTINNYSWRSVCWSPELGLFVAVASGGSDRVMTSPDGITWTSRSTGVLLTNCNNAGGNTITCSNTTGLIIGMSLGLVTGSGTIPANTTITSIINLTSFTTNNTTSDLSNTTLKADNSWQSVCWSPELGLFVAVASAGGANNRVMTSPDGIIWTTRTTNDNSWRSVCWSPELGLFVAVAFGGGANNRVMTSPDGITWTTRTTNDNQWRGVCWSPEVGVFVAVSNTGTDRVMTSSLTGRPPTSYNVFDSSFNQVDQSGNWTIQQVMKSATVAAASSISVAGMNLMYITGSGIIITNLTGGVANQELVLVFNDNNIQLSAAGSNPPLRLSSSSFGGASSANDTISLLFTGTEWYELTRSANT